MKPANLLRNLPVDSGREVFETLLESGPLKIERITSRGQTTPSGEWLCEDTAEWVALLQGEARLEFASESTETYLTRGDYLYIPPGSRHRVNMTSRSPPAVWLAIHVTDPAAGNPPV